MFDPDKPLRAVYLIKQLQVGLRTILDDAVRPTGLTMPELIVLDALHRKPGATNAALARSAMITPQSMITVLRSLERKRFLERFASERGGREMPNHVTEAGRQHMFAALEIVGAVNDRMMEQFSDDEREQFQQMLLSCLRSVGNVATI